MDIPDQVSINDMKNSRLMVIDWNQLCGADVVNKIRNEKFLVIAKSEQFHALIYWQNTLSLFLGDIWISDVFKETAFAGSVDELRSIINNRVDQKIKL